MTYCDSTTTIRNYILMDITIVIISIALFLTWSDMKIWLAVSNLDSSDQEAANKAYQTITDIGEPATASLKLVLDSPKSTPRAKALALKALMHIGTSEAIETVLTATKNDTNYRLVINYLKEIKEARKALAKVVIPLPSLSTNS